MDAEDLEDAEKLDVMTRFQLVRRVIMALLVSLAFGILAFGGSLHDELTHERIETLGLALIVIGIGGRLWSTLYIGGRKATEVVSIGPYSVTRNPLYVFSTIAAAGIGAQTGSYVVACAFMLVCAFVFYFVTLREERFLTEMLGDEYLAYMSRVPRFLPNPFIFRDEEEVTFLPRLIRRTFLDSLVLLAAVPALELVEMAQEKGQVPILFHLF